MRLDRDSHIKINTQNIQAGNFFLILDIFYVKTKEKKLVTALL